jgi:hypothetical protein
VTARFILYTRQGCHLCDDLLDQLASLPCEDQLAIELVDIDSDPEIHRLYARRIPVLLDADTGELLSEYRLDRNRVLTHLGMGSSPDK